MTVRVFQSIVLRRKLQTKDGSHNGRCCKLHHEELHKFYYSPNVIKMQTSRKIRYMRYVACMGRRRMRAGVRCEQRKEKNH
jgi:hypothetical protein